MKNISKANASLKRNNHKLVFQYQLKEKSIKSTGSKKQVETKNKSLQKVLQQKEELLKG